MAAFGTAFTVSISASAAAGESMIDVRVEKRGEAFIGVPEEAFRLEIDGEPIEPLRVEAITPADPLPRRVLVFIDDFFSVPSERNHVLDILAQEVALLSPADRMAVLAFDGTTVEVLTGWTRSIRTLEDAFSRARARPSQGLLRLTEQRQFELSQRLRPRSATSSGSFAGIGLSGSSQPDQGAISLRRAREITGQVARVLRAATAALYALPTEQRRDATRRDAHRNVMIMLSGGWQVAPDRWIVNPGSGGPYTGLRAAESLFAPLIESADQKGFTIYPVAVPNWSPDIAGPRRNALVDEMLTRLAVDTGGAAILDDRHISKVLEPILDDLGAYYRIHFDLPRRHDDRRRRLRVDVDGGPRIRTRTGLADRSRQVEIACLVESAGFLDRPLPGTENLEVAIRAAAGGRDVPLEIQIDAGAVSLRPEGDAYVADLELRVARFADDEPIGDSEARPLRLVRSAMPGRGDILVHETRVKVPRKAERLLVSIYDPRDGTLLTKAVVVPP